MLEDVDLARLVKRSGRKIRFRYGRDAVKTRMYRTFRQMWEGWTKNLALLFPDSMKLALLKGLEFVVCAVSVPLFFAGIEFRSRTVWGIALVAGSSVAATFFYRVRKAHFGWFNTLISPIGIPIFVLLLVRSRLHYKNNDVVWK